MLAEIMEHWTVYNGFHLISMIDVEPQWTDG